MPLRRFFLNTRIFGPRGLAFDDAHDAGVGDKRRAGQDFAAVLSTSSDFAERQRRAGLARPCRRSSTERRRASTFTLPIRPLE